MTKKQEINTEAEKKFGLIRLRANQKLPYFGYFLFSAIPVQKPGIGSVGVDRHGRIYYDPDFVLGNDKDTVATQLIHEILHLGLMHYKRMMTFLGTDKPDPVDVKLWGHAVDCVVNVIQRDAGFFLPDGAILPCNFGLPENLSAEEYFERLRENKNLMNKLKNECQGQGKGGGKGDGTGNGMGKGPCKGDGGSASDGQQREWEDDAPSGDGDGEGDNDVPPAISEFEQMVMARQCAEQVQKSAGRDTMPAGLKLWADEIIDPKIDVEKEILARVRHAYNQAAGCRDFSYQKPNRRGHGAGVIMPAMRSPVPRVAVILDSSGSMLGRDLSYGLGVISNVIDALPSKSGVFVMTGDTHTATAKTVFRTEQVEIGGGGGTDMTVLLEDACTRRPLPQVIVLFTDGYTPWPKQELPVPVVAIITQDGTKSAPSWISQVQLDKENK